MLDLWYFIRYSGCYCASKYVHVYKGVIQTDEGATAKGGGHRANIYGQE